MKKIIIILTFVLAVNFLLADLIWNDDFEEISGWMLSGEFEIGAPQGLGGEYGNADPEAAFQGNNVLGVDLSGDGDYGASIPDRGISAISPAIDCSDFMWVNLSFMRWLNVEQPAYDHAYIDISNDNGVTWTEIWTNTEGIEDSDWSEMNLDISSFADGVGEIKLRFSIGPTDGSWFYSGWNIDCLEITGQYAVFANISGTVTDVNTGESIEGALVMDNYFSTVTDSDGNYSLDVLIGENDITVRNQNYFEEYYPINLVEDEEFVLDFILTLYSAPENLIGEDIEDSVILSWNAPQNQLQPVSAYNVYRNGLIIQTVSDSFYTDTNLIENSYEYFVTAVYVYGNSVPSNIVEIGVLDAENFLDFTGLSLTNYPNPFNPTTIITYNLDSNVEVNIGIYNVKGQLINTIVDEYQIAGEHSIIWNGTGANGKNVASGIYYYKFSSLEYQVIKKMILVK